MPKQMPSPPPSSQPAADMDTSVLDSSPDQSPRRSWKDSRRPPAPEPRTTRQSSRRSRYSSATSRPRSLREPAPLMETPTRPPSTRGRTPTVRDRSPLVALEQPAPMPAPRQPQGPVAPATSRQSTAPSPRDLRDTLTARGLPAPLLPARDPSPQPGTSTGIRHPPFFPRRLLGSSDSTLTAPSPQPRSTWRPAHSSPEEFSAAPPPPRRSRSPFRAPRPRSPPRKTSGRERAPARTPPRPQREILVLPRTPGYSSPEADPVLDVTRMYRPPVPPRDSPSASEVPWDRRSSEPEVPAPADPPQEAPADAPLAWGHVVDFIYHSGLVDTASLPVTPTPVQSVIGGPQAPEPRKTALPPSPLAAASLSAAMRSCWGGPWSSYAQHQPPPPNAALHPGPAAWVPEFRAKYHAGPGIDLRPARLSAREREWAGTAQPPVEHSWLADIDSLARAQLSSLSNLEWLFGVYMDSSPRASAAELDALKGFIVKELHLAINFSGAQIAASTLGRRRAILNNLQQQLNLTTRNWLQLQPVELLTTQGLFGPASALVPEIMRQQPVPRSQPPNRRRGNRGPARRDPPRASSAPATQAQQARRPAATYTPSAAAAVAPPPVPQPARSRGRGGRQPSTRGAKGPQSQA